MKKTFKSKFMFVFFAFIMGVFYLNAKDIQKMETMKAGEENAYVAINA